MNTILGIKQEQTQRFLENGMRIPVTVIRVPQNVVVAVKTAEKDGYQALQIGMGARKKATKALLGHAKKANLTTAPQVLKEVKTDTALSQGEFVAIASVLAPGDIVKVTGTSKGKGFAGGVKRYGFRGGPRTHGQSDRERAPGSLGQTTTPGRVYKGKRMAGHMGAVVASVTNLVVVGVDENAGQILIKGLVPGSLGSVVSITKTASLPEKKIHALLPDPFAPAPQEEPQVEEETPAQEENIANEDSTNVEKVDEIEKVDAAEATEPVALSEEKKEETAAPAAEPAEEKVAEATESEESKVTEESKEEEKA